MMKILIVDDSMEWVKFHINLLNQFFEKGSAEIYFEMSAKSGFNRVLKEAKSPYDIIISDLEMEKMQDDSYAGSWFVRNILARKECCSSKIIIISGSYDISDIAKGFNVDFIPKDVILNNPQALLYYCKQ